LLPLFPDRSRRIVGRVLTLRRAHLAAFVTLYPLLDCGPGGCPEASHAAHASFSTARLVAVLAASPAVLASFFRRAACTGEVGEPT
jgi:hypothetical protein